MAAKNSTGEPDPAPFKIHVMTRAALCARAASRCERFPIRTKPSDLRVASLAGTTRYTTRTEKFGRHPSESPGAPDTALVVFNSGRCLAAVSMRILPHGRKNARRRNDWIWGHCNSLTSRSYYTAMRPRPTLTSTASASGSAFFRSRREVGTAFPACPRAKPNRDWRSRLRLISSAMISRRAQEDGACG